MKAAAAIVANIGIVSGVVYVVQVCAQIRLYGLRRWWEFGLGTGVHVHPEDESAEELLADYEGGDA